MSAMAKLAYFVGVLLFILFLKGGHVGGALLVLLLALLAGVWRIWCHIRAAREREAAQWQVEVAIPEKLRRPGLGRPS